MADPAAPSIDNLKIAQQLLAAMNEVSGQLEKQLRIYRSQTELVEGIVKAQEAMGKVDTSKSKEISDGFDKARQSAMGFSEQVSESEKKTKDLEASLEKAKNSAKKLSIGSEFVKGLKAGFNLTTALFGSLMRIGGTGLKGILGLGKALLSIPGSILNFFQQNAGGGSDPWREAIEELRDKFGALQMGTSKAVLSMMDNVNQFNASGLRLSRVFGYGRAGAAAVLKEFTKLAEEMGPASMRFFEATKNISGELLVMTKATGLSGAALKTLQISADNGGESVSTAVERMNIALVRAQRTFGISAKEMGKDLEIMMKDVGSFGVMTRDSMIKASVYVKKLGLSMEALKKVMDKTLNFEDAAASAAGMAEAFNMNIDAFKLMKEQDPTKKLDILRQAFFRTGKNIDQMSIAERKHLANLSGMSEEETRIAFAQKNRALTGAALDAQMKKSQKTQITQEQAMHELADSIKRLVLSGSGLQSGFFDIFFKGFERGIVRSREFRKISREIQRDLRIVYMTGVQVGRMFVNLFPGMQDFFGGLRDMLDPRKFRELMGKVKTAFRDFFIDLERNPRAGFANFMQRIKRSFFDMFNSNSEGGRKFLTGLKAFWKAAGAIVVGGLKYAFGMLKDIALKITDFIKNPHSFLAAGSNAGSGLTGALIEMFKYAKEELGPILSELGKALSEMFKTMWETTVKPYFKAHGKGLIIGILGFIFGPAIVAGSIRGLIAGVLGGFGGGSGGGGIFSAIANRIKRMFSNSFGGTGNENDMNSTSIAQTAANTIKNMTKAAGGVLIAVGALAAIMYLLMPKFQELLGFIQRQNISAASVGTALLAIGGIALFFVGLDRIKFFQSMETIGGAINKSNIGKIAIGVGAGLITLGVVGLAAYATVRAFKSFKPEEIKGAMGAMTSMTGLFFSTIPLVVALGLFGAALAITGGAGALAIAAGMAVIGSAIISIARVTTSIVAMFNGMDPNQVSVASKAVESVGGLYGTIGGMMSSMSILSIIRPRAIIGFIEAISELIRIISISTIGIIQSINVVGDPNALKAKAELFSAAMGGVASILTPLTTFASNSRLISIINPDAMLKITTSINNFIDRVFGSLAQLVQRIISIPNITDDSLKAANVFTQITQAIGGLLTSVGSFANNRGMDAVYQQLTTALTDTADPLSMALSSISRFLGDERGGFVKVIGDITNSFSRLSVENIKKLVDIGPFLAGISGFLGPTLTAVTAIAETIKGKSSSEVDGILFEFRQLFESLSRNMKSLLDFVPSVISSLNGLDNLSGIQTKAQSLKGVFDVIGQITSIITNLRPPSIGFSGTRQLNQYSDVFFPAMSMLGWIFYKGGKVPGTDIDGHGEMLEGVLLGISRINLPRGIAAKAAQLKNVFDSIKSIAEATNSIKNLGSNGGLISPYVMNIPLANLALLVDSLKSEKININGTERLNPLRNPNMYFDPLVAMQSGLRGKGSIITSLKNTLMEILGSTKGITDIPTVTAATNLNTSLSNMAVTFSTLQAYFGENSEFSGTRISTITAGINSRLIADVRNMVTQYNSFSRELSRLNSVNIDATLTKLGEGLGSDRQIRIEQATANVTVNLKVTLAAKDIAQALYDQSRAIGTTGPNVALNRGTAFVPGTQDTSGY